MRIYLIYQVHAYYLEVDKTYCLGAHSCCDIQIPLDTPIDVTSQLNRVCVDTMYYTYGYHTLVLQHAVTIQLLILPTSQFILMPDTPLVIANDTSASIVVAGFQHLLTLVQQANTDDWQLIAPVPIYVNGRLKDETVYLRKNDVIVVDGLMLCWQERVLEIASIYPITSHLVTFTESPFIKEHASVFYRSPRIRLKEPNNTIDIAPVPIDTTIGRQPLLKLLVPPIAMLLFAWLSSMLAAGSGMVIMLFGMSVVTIGLSIYQYVSDKKAQRLKQTQTVAQYMTYLDSKYVELEQYRHAQQTALLYHYPKLEELLEMTQQCNSRIYEKTKQHTDFLSYQIGIGQIQASFTIHYRQNDMNMHNDSLIQAVDRLVTYYRYIDRMPITHIIRAPIGYVGQQEIVIEQVQQLLMQVAFFHSYHDVQFILIYHAETYAQWAWSRWLPHVYWHVRGCIYNQETTEQLLNVLYRCINERKNNSEQTYPTYIVVITDRHLLLKHPVMAYVNEDLSYLGIHYVFVTDTLASLPEQVTTIVEFKDKKQARMLMRNGESSNQTCLPLVAIDNKDKDDFARNLASIQHVQHGVLPIPHTVSFLDMYGVSDVKALQIQMRWQSNQTYQTLAVPLGLKEANEVLYLDLHEKAHGPHALIAGTTGSGKSELLQSYILSLAINYHPYQVAFLLIDYKGAGMARCFEMLPHVLGTMTNLDTHQVERALLAIKAEVKKRQRIFLEQNVSHIDAYSKLFQQGQLQEALPHLFIISDEFAELKEAQPDFIQELVSIARVGRSLGIHLLLATQKPSGVVNEQIWANATCKIALKVQDVADSQEILKRPDAAMIQQIGRAYLQVGHHEVYEQFQSAYSGAMYQPKTHEAMTNRLYEIDKSGRYIPIQNEMAVATMAQQVMQLDGIVNDIHQTFAKTGLPKLNPLWLPPLSTHVYAENYQSINFHDYWEQDASEASILIGYQDIPAQQKQAPLYINMSQTAHILLVGSQGFGKSTFLQSLAIDTMRKQTPAQAHFYLYDFGTKGITMLADFPHVVDYFHLDDSDKVMTSLRLLQQEMTRRQQLLRQFKLENIPSIYIIIDDFDALIDAPFADDFEDVMRIVARSGVALGMYLVVTLSRFNAMRLSLQAYFKTKIALHVFDTSDLLNIVGCTHGVSVNMKGRALIKLTDVVQFQVTLPYNCDTYTDYMCAIQKEVCAMQQAYQGTLPQKIPMLPKKIDSRILESVTLTDRDFMLGLTSETVLPAIFSFDKTFVMASDNPLFVQGYYCLLAFYLEKLAQTHRVFILDTNQLIACHLFKGIQRFSQVEDVLYTMRMVLVELKKRLTGAKTYTQKWFILIPDIQAFVSATAIQVSDFKLLLTVGHVYGITCMFVGNYRDLVQPTYDTFVSLVNQLVEQVFLGMRMSDQHYRQYAYMHQEAMLQANQGYILRQDSYELIQLMEV